MKPSESWESRVADLWKRIDEFAPEEFVLQVERLAAELDAPSDELDEAAVSLTAPARYLPRYNKSLARYAQGILN